MKTHTNPLSIKPMRSLLARRVHFSCGHRYFNKNWSKEKNQKIFGLCYSEHGHGHNYILDAYIEGSVNPETGMIINLKDVDILLNEVVRPLDHQYLNDDVEEFKTQVPTTENIARYCFEQLHEKISYSDNSSSGSSSNSDSNDDCRNIFSIRLHKVRLFENDDLWVEYGNLL